MGAVDVYRSFIATGHSHGYRTAASGGKRLGNHGPTTR